MVNMLVYFEERISKNKAISLQIGKWELCDWFDFSIKWSRREDHAGFRVHLELLSCYFYFDIYDTRHWNLEHKRWWQEGDRDDD